MPLHDASYKHWDGVHLGIWDRRLAITENGLTACLQNKLTRHLLVICWLSALVMSGLMFLVGQLLVSDSIMVQWVGNFNPQLQIFAQLLTTWLEQHPDISVRATQNIFFYYYSTNLMRFSIFALGIAMPLLVTRDLASNAIIIYSSKAISRGDYLLAKFATAFGLIALAWLGPVCAAWFVGNLLAPDWSFFWHARAALGHVLLYGLSSMVILSLLALGVSAISIKEKSTTAFWMIWWILGGVLTPIALQTKPWLRHLSFNFNLDQIGIAVFRIGDDIKTTQENIPIFGEMLRKISARTIEGLSSPAIGGAGFALLVMLALAGWIIRKRVKPE
jgi:hypothetical protein